MQYVRELLEEKVNEVFAECQDKRHIVYGDVSPLDVIRLDTLLDTLAKHITKILDDQTP